MGSHLLRASWRKDIGFCTKPHLSDKGRRVPDDNSSQPLSIFPKHQKNPRITFGELNDVTLGSSAVCETQSPKEEPEKSRKQVPDIFLGPVAFRPHFSMGLALGLIANDLVGLPRAIFPREALYRKFEGLIH